MGYNFIYVFDTASRDKLLAAGFILLKEDAGSRVYIFKADSALRFDLNGMDYVMSDTLSF